MIGYCSPFHEQPGSLNKFAKGSMVFSYCGIHTCAHLFSIGLSAGEWNFIDDDALARHKMELAGYGTSFLVAETFCQVIQRAGGSYHRQISAITPHLPFMECVNTVITKCHSPAGRSM